ncbi:hypothetical protein MTR_8g018710 [Medicago truncatula]|uniref:Uncharacterized protein n=1 Tax=Medicago truncatula TaxID=3880 RepID=G7LIZ4_MEDTR|nr:hypothetical protein MTR_8g018710 [Medicago truncatula]
MVLHDSFGSGSDGYVCSQLRWLWIGHKGGDGSDMSSPMSCYGFEESLIVLVCGTSWWFSWWG